MLVVLRTLLEEEAEDVVPVGGQVGGGGRVDAEQHLRGANQARQAAVPARHLGGEGGIAGQGVPEQVLGEGQVKQKIILARCRFMYGKLIMCDI